MRNHDHKITRFIHPDGLTTIFSLDVSLEEAQQLGCDMEELHMDLVMRAVLTETLYPLQQMVRRN